jgi:hypothetical protein
MGVNDRHAVRPPLKDAHVQFDLAARPSFAANRTSVVVDHDKIFGLHVAFA